MLTSGQLISKYAASLNYLTQTRCISCTPVVNYIQKWRKERGLPMNPNAYGVLTDAPDYSFIDGRPTPYGSRQKLRILGQKAISEKIIRLTKEVDLK